MRSTTALRRYGLALAATLAATGLEVVLWPWIAPSLSPLFTAAVVVTAMFAGLGPAIFATLLSFVASAFFLLPPTYSFSIGGDDLHRLFVFAGVAILVSSVAAAKRRAEMNAEQARIEAERANRAKDDFLALVSHELRSPLSPIVMVSHLMEDDLSLPEKVREDAAMIRRNVANQTRLIDDLLDSCRIKSGKLQMQWAPLNLQQALNDAIHTVCEQATAKQIGIEVVQESADEHLPVEIVGDYTRLCQVFSNLLRNAIKFTPNGGQVTIHCKHRDGWVQTRVSDTGIGIGSDLLPRLFVAFQQGGDHVTKRFGGLGLGLWIAKGIVEAHGGHISASSAGHHCGATFTVELPIMAEQPPSVDGDPHRKVAPRAGVVGRTAGTLQRAVNRLVMSAMPSA